MSTILREILSFVMLILWQSYTMMIHNPIDHVNSFVYKTKRKNQSGDGFPVN
jgi:hypothetical protein